MSQMTLGGRVASSWEPDVGHRRPARVGATPTRRWTSRHHHPMCGPQDIRLARPCPRASECRRARLCPCGRSDHPGPSPSDARPGTGATGDFAARPRPAAGGGARGLAPGLRGPVPDPSPAPSRWQHLSGREDGGYRPQDPSPALEQAWHQAVTPRPGPLAARRSSDGDVLPAATMGSAGSVAGRGRLRWGGPTPSPWLSGPSVPGADGGS